MNKKSHPLYSTWRGMRKRCLMKTHPRFYNWGGRGITICKRWDDFAAFAADMGPRPKGYFLDRIDVNGNYEPSNCRWADPFTHAVNVRPEKRNIPVKFLTLNGETRTVRQWEEKLGLKCGALCHRLKDGWPLDEALTVPKVSRKQHCRPQLRRPP